MNSKTLQIIVVLLVSLMVHLVFAPYWVPASAQITLGSIQRLQKERNQEVSVGPFADQRSCGVESLYLLMQLCGCLCSLEQVKNKTTIQEKGSSLRDIQSAAEELGLPLECVRCSPEKLSKLTLPAIAHMEPIPEMQFVNHFVVLVRADDESVTIVDPADNGIHDVPRRVWTRMATGYYLSPRSMLFGWSWTIAWLLAGLIALRFWFRWPRVAKSPYRAKEVLQRGIR